MAETIDVSWQVLLWVLPVMVFSGLVHGALGLGFPMVATPIIAVFLDVKLAILITLLPTGQSPSSRPTLTWTSQQTQVH